MWRVDIEIEPDPLTHRRRRVSKTVYGSRDDAEVVLARFRVAAHDKRLPPAGTSARSVAGVLQIYVTAVESGVIEQSPRTVVTIRSSARTIASSMLTDGRTFGHLRLSTLAWQDIEDLYRSLRSRGLGTSWIRRCATVLTQSLELARKRGLIDGNPAKDAARPRTVRIKPHAPSADELRRAIAISRQTDAEIGDAVALLATTGMRKGELLALRWCDVDLVRGELNVSAGVVDGGPGIGLVRKPTKRSDWRDIPLTRSGIAVLEQQLERQRARGQGDGRTSYVFSSAADGAQPLRPDTFTSRWGAARGSSEITLQHVRHYAATTMLDAGESYRTVAHILGNSESTLRLHYDGRTDVGTRRAIAALEL